MRAMLNESAVVPALRTEMSKEPCQRESMYRTGWQHACKAWGHQLLSASSAWEGWAGASRAPAFVFSFCL